MEFLMMCMRMQLQAWGAVVQLGAQMMNPFAYLPKGGASARVSITAEMRESSASSNLEDREEMRRALKEFRRQVQDIWPEDIIGGGK